MWENWSNTISRTYSESPWQPSDSAELLWQQPLQPMSMVIGTITKQTKKCYSQLETPNHLGKP